MEVARRAHTTAMMALIFSVGAMLTAIAQQSSPSWLCEARRFPSD